MRGVPQRSWAAWLAGALDLGLVNLAQDGEVARGVRRRQLSRAGAGHGLAVLYVGVNDARGPGWDAAAFSAVISAVLTGLSERAARVLAVAGPRDLGRPPAGAAASEANAAVRREAARTGAVLVDLGRWPHGMGHRSRELVWPDRVHPTPLGQLAIADVAARALGAPRRPSAAVLVRRGPVADTRWALHRAGAELDDRWRRARERVRPPG